MYIDNNNFDAAKSRSLSMKGAVSRNSIKFPANLCGILCYHLDYLNGLPVGSSFVVLGMNPPPLQHLELTCRESTQSRAPAVPTLRDPPTSMTLALLLAPV